MPRIVNRKEPLLPEKTERCSLSQSRRCFRTDCVVSAVLVGLLAMFVTWGSSGIVKAGYELVQARACLTKLEKQNELLRLEMARLKAPQRIQDIATRELGMVKPQALYIVAKSSRESRVPKEEQAVVAVRSSVLFGNARAEAHKAR